MHFLDRQQAGQRLARVLQHYQGSSAVVVGLARGGAVVGEMVARSLGCVFDVLVVKKVSHPMNAEVAIGAVTVGGEPVIDEQVRQSLPAYWLAETLLDKRREAVRQETLFRPYRPVYTQAGRPAIIVDDGVATGFTALAAVKKMMLLHPSEIVVATPVIPAETLAVLQHEQCTVVTLAAPQHFNGSVGSYYHDFPQISNDEVIDVLRRARLHHELSSVSRGGEKYVQRTTRTERARSRT